VRAVTGGADGSAHDASTGLYSGEEGVVHETVRKTTSVHPASETFSKIHERLLEQMSALEQHFGEALHDCERTAVFALRTG
jgi:hypothetical protein